MVVPDLLKQAGRPILAMKNHWSALHHGFINLGSGLYAIRVRGHLGATALSAFPDLTPRWHGAHTVLTGLMDRSALYGVLAEAEALGLDLVELRLLTPCCEPPDSGDIRPP